MKTRLPLDISKRLSFFKFAIALALPALFIAACSKENTSQALVMAVNASPSSAAQNFYIDGSKLNTTALTYGNSTGYLQLTANNNHQATFKNSSADTVDATASIAPTPGDHYSAYFSNSNTINIYPNDLTTPKSGSSRVRFINLSAGLTGSSVDFAGIVSGKDTVITSGAQYALASPYNQISTLSNTFTLALTGTNAVLLSMPVVLQAGKIYSLVISGPSSTALTYSLVAEN